MHYNFAVAARMLLERSAHRHPFSLVNDGGFRDPDPPPINATEDKKLLTLQTRLARAKQKTRHMDLKMYKACCFLRSVRLCVLPTAVGHRGRSVNGTCRTLHAYLSFEYALTDAQSFKHGCSGQLLTTSVGEASEENGYF